VKRLIAIGIALVLAVVVVPAYLIFSGPHMDVQPHLRAFQAVMPPMPAGTVPVSDPLPAPLSAEGAARMTNPLSATRQNIAHGRTYYGYYCGFCHGEAGDGRGPVAESYDPAPSDLRTPKVQSLPDGRLLYASLTGVGHSSVLERVVPEEARWPIVLYVRSLGAAPAELDKATHGLAD
jgi:mono/diheme cytochrome c family protein